MSAHYCPSCFAEKTEHAGPCPRCGYDPAGDRDKYPLALPHGSILAGQYITGRALGQGGFGITYLALNVKTGVRCAIKEFFPETMATRLAGSPQVTAFSGQQQENFRYGLGQFLEEARILAQFQNNPHIVGVRSYFEENGTAYFVMDYVEGDSFKAYIKNQGGRVSWEDAVRILTPVMDALAAVHQQGIIHRDVAPDNIFLTADGTVRLLDFGAARYSLGDKSKSLDVVLKAGYAPKEQYMRRGKQGPFTDVYSLAACFYASITGRIPPEAIERMDQDTLLPPSQLAPLPPGLEAVILTGLQIQAENRYQSMGEFRAALDNGIKPRPDMNGRFLPEGTRLSNRYVVLQPSNRGRLSCVGNLYQVRDEQAPVNGLMLLEYYPRVAERVGYAVRGRQPAEFEQGKEIFRNKARLCLRDIHHAGGRRNITGIYDYFEENNTVYAVLYPEEGTPLTEYLAAHGGKLPWGDAITLLRPVAEALKFYHSCNHVFQNLELGRVLITNTGEVILADLFYDHRAGVAGAGYFSESCTMPIELYNSKTEVSPSTDVYSLAVCFYFMITGQRPPVSTDRLKQDTLIPPYRLSISIPRSAEQAILKGLSLKAADRQHSVDAFFDPLAILPPPPPPPSADTLKKIKQYFLIGILLILIGPILSVVTLLTLPDMGVRYSIYITLFCACFLLPPAVILPFASQLGMGGAGMKRMGIAAIPLLATVIFTLAARFGGDPAGAFAAEFGGWLIFFCEFLYTQTLIPGHPKAGAPLGGSAKMRVLGILFFAYGAFLSLTPFF